MGTTIGEKEGKVKENRMTSVLRSVLKMHLEIIGAIMEVHVFMPSSAGEGVSLGAKTSGTIDARKAAQRSKKAAQSPNDQQHSPFSCGSESDRAEF